MDDEKRPLPTTAGRESLTLATELGETVVGEVVGLGATLVVTTVRVVVVREGAHFRPRNGVRAWPFEALLDVLLESPRHGSGRVVLRVGRYPWQAVSLFVGAEEWPAAERLVGQIRVRLALSRRSQSRLKRSRPKP